MTRNILIILLGMLAFGFAGGASAPVIIEIIGKSKDPLTNAFYNGFPPVMYFIAAPLAGKLIERSGARASLLFGSLFVNGALVCFALFYNSSKGLFITNFIVITGAAFLRVGGNTVINQNSQAVRELAQPLFSLSTKVGTLLGRGSLELSKLVPALQAVRSSYPFAPFLISGAAFVLSSTAALLFLWKPQKTESIPQKSKPKLKIVEYLSVLPLPSIIALFLSRFVESSVAFSIVILFHSNYEGFLRSQSIGVCATAIALALAGHFYKGLMSRFLTVETVIVLSFVVITGYGVLISATTNILILSLSFLVLGAIANCLDVFGRLFYGNFYDSQPEMQPRASAVAEIFTNFGAISGYIISGFLLTFLPNYTWHVCLGVSVVALCVGIYHRLKIVAD